MGSHIDIIEEIIEDLVKELRQNKSNLLSLLTLPSIVFVLLHHSTKHLPYGE